MSLVWQADQNHLHVLESLSGVANFGGLQLPVPTELLLLGSISQTSMGHIKTHQQMEACTRSLQEL